MGMSVVVEYGESSSCGGWPQQSDRLESGPIPIGLGHFCTRHGDPNELLASLSSLAERQAEVPPASEDLASEFKGLQPVGIQVPVDPRYRTIVAISVVVA
jgi:hypothetical protein